MQPYHPTNRPVVTTFGAWDALTIAAVLAVVGGGVALIIYDRRRRQKQQTTGA